MFLDTPYRQKGNGKLLSRSRYLFMAQFRERFPDQVMADLRGYYDNQGRSPFWDAIGQHFFQMDFNEADLFGALNGNQFIADLMPKQPIYVNLLAQTARDVIGRPNDEGRAALAMLEKEGFLWRGQIDIFDGAPSVDTFIDQIETIRSSTTSKIAGHGHSSGATEYLVCGGDIGSFAACISSVEISPSGDVLLPIETVTGLGLSIGDPVRYVEL